jgi:ADP-heptose:LPS heptosyltransferase
MRPKDYAISALCRLLRHLFRQGTPPIADFPPPASILILKPCCLGDVLFATPTVAALRRAFPAARLDFAVGPWSRPVVATNPHLDGILDCGRVGGDGYSLRDYLALARRIRAGRYRACFVLDRSPLISLLPCLAGVPWRIGLDSQGRGFSLTVPVPVVGIRHEAEIYLDTARAVGVAVTGARLEYHPAPQDHAFVNKLIKGEEQKTGASKQPPVGGQRPLVLIHPGGGTNPGMTMASKRWPAERFAAVADHLQAEGMPVILVGGPEDGPIAGAVAALMESEPLDLTGQLTWGQLGALQAQAALYIGNDTGATHLAVAVGCRQVIAIFGPSDPRRYGPYAPPEQAVALWHDPGVPAGGVAAGEPVGFTWEGGVTVEEVLTAAGRMLGLLKKPVF